MHLPISISLLTLLPDLFGFSTEVLAKKSCRVQPGDPGFPSVQQWSQLSAQVGGRLVQVVPSAKFCHSLPAGNCTQDQWTSTTFRSTIPGAMDAYNWEQDYSSNPPSLCFQNGTTCDQGNVPLYAINASSGFDIQAGVKFAAKHNLRVAIKASGHDYLGRSTAKNSLLLWTRNLRNISFTGHFVRGGKDYGSAVTVGSGAPLNAIYTATKAVGKMFVGGTAATVVAAGGYVQGAGHSAFSPLLGLAADNALEFQVVVASGDIKTANEFENPDLFYALRGGGAGSWGVIISATLRTYPIFNATQHVVVVFAPTNASIGTIMTLHAKHIFDWDSKRAGQYFYAINGGSQGNFAAFSTYFPNSTADDAAAAMKPLLDDVQAMNFTILSQNTTVALANDLVFSPDDQLGVDAILGSRLIPADAYRNDPVSIGNSYTKLLELGAAQIIGHLVAGGKVAENANIDSAVNPKWRTAKAHVVAAVGWGDSTPLSVVEFIKESMTNQAVPILANMTGQADSGAYSNEADVREPNFQTTFFGGGARYQKLLQVKRKYDPNDLFIVAAGVGSEDWDAAGLCRVH
ncbi:FAD-binding domain-containing protein [Rickenella mellea]|uniref:FAD-binding domain-containing protein n=1 Tax=Rickenella mellea TaxID=50990 RepID=A0A4Y7PUB6_9AGAM|nr:FAD-binding domain-containing protein [Rickenella mellea]